MVPLNFCLLEASSKTLFILLDYYICLLCIPNFYKSLFQSSTPPGWSWCLRDVGHFFSSVLKITYLLKINKKKRRKMPFVLKIFATNLFFTGQPSCKAQKNKSSDELFFMIAIKMNNYMGDFASKRIYWKLSCRQYKDLIIQEPHATVQIN